MSRGQTRGAAHTPTDDNESGKRCSLGIRVTRRTNERLLAQTGTTGRSLASEVEHLLEEALRHRATGRLLDALEDIVWTAGYGDDWVADPDRFNTVVNRWLDYLDSVRPARSPGDEAEIRKEYEQLRQDIKETPAAVQRGLRRHAQSLSENGLTLDPEMRLRYRLLAEEEQP